MKEKGICNKRIKTRIGEIKMNTKEELILKFAKLQNKIANVFVENEHLINEEVNELLTDVTLTLNDAMLLVANLEEEE